MKLNNKYNREDFEFFLNDFLPDDYKSELKDIELDERCKVIKSACVLGECESIGLKVIELGHEKERDPRVTLASEAFKIMADTWSKKALVVFKSNNSDNWRLSYMTITLDINEMNKIAQSFSNPRRKSFYLGPDAKVVTPHKFLIKQDRIKTIDDLEACFDVEVVTKEFFNNYRELYNKLSEYLKEDKAFNAFAGNNNIKLEDFAKKLLGQIVFIYFLQKKGWLGAKKEDQIYKGDPSFLRTLFTKCESEGKNYFNDYLEYLFYDAFNKESEKAGSFYRDYFDCQIPFLNGGLFEPLNGYNWQQSFLHIPNELFSNKNKDGILDIFDLYNFTIDENSTIDQEVSVDPEMLGKVFEKLLDTNKETGSFYTPREIVAYMVKQSLIEYLKTKTSVKPEDIEALVNDHRTFVPELDKKEFRAVEEALKEIKIIDPAVGSGAFPVGILQEMAEIRKICLDRTTIKARLPYDIKREILENNIYGVDIDHGAIDIARLRFWLSLVVDAELTDVEPLPNLEFKLIAANTLISLDGEEGLYDEKDLLEKMKDIRGRYFRARKKHRKEGIQNEFKKLVSKSNNMFATERQKQLMSYDPFSPSTVAQFFNSKFMFGVKEFDLVIGNPPYVNIFNIKDEVYREYVKKNYLTYKNKTDLYAFFVEKGLELIKDGGFLYFIISNSWLGTDSFSKFREFLLAKTRVIDLVKCYPEVFEASVTTVIIGFEKKEVSENSINLKSFDGVFRAIGHNLTYKQISDQPSLGFTFEKQIKINVESVSLGSVCNFSLGIKTSDDKKFISETKETDEHYKLLRGKDIDFYRYTYSGKYIWYRPDLMKKKKGAGPRNKEIFLVDKKILVKDVASNICATLDENQYFVTDTLNVIYNVKFGYDVYSILGIINSKLIRAWFKISFPAGLHIKINQLKQIPIPKITQENKNKFAIICGLVKDVIRNDTKQIRKEIDQAVYNLYSLTDEEIKIIEDNGK